MPLRVMVIVEGHGEDQAIRPLLERIWYELLSSDYIEILKPWRQPQGTLLKKDGLQKNVKAASIKLNADKKDDTQNLLLILIDAEKKCPKTLAPKLLQWAKEIRSDIEIAVVIPNPMFETWFAASASSLQGVNDLPNELSTPENPEANRVGKAWLKRQLNRKYKEPIDQPRFVDKIDLSVCRRNSASFDKLCRELEKRLTRQEQSNDTE